MVGERVGTAEASSWVPLRFSLERELLFVSDSWGEKQPFLMHCPHPSLWSPTQHQPPTVSQVYRRLEMCQVSFSTAAFGLNVLKWTWHCDSMSFSLPNQYIKGDFKDVYWNIKIVRDQKLDFPGGPVVRNLPASAGKMGSTPGPGRFHVLGRN